MASITPTVSPKIQWRECIKCSLPSQSQISQIEGQFDISLPPSYHALVSLHAGQQPIGVHLSAQHVNTKRWTHCEVGPFYHFDDRDDAAIDDDDSSAGQKSVSVAAVNQSFIDDLASDDKSAHSSSLPFFAFSESMSGQLFVIERSSASILLMDPLQRRGPYVVAENFDDFIKRINRTVETHCTDDDDDESGKQYEVEDKTQYHTAANGYEDNINDDEGVNDDAELKDDDYADDDEENDDEGDVYCCDVCMSVIDGVRFHCRDCGDVDLCADCESSNATTQRHTITHHTEAFNPS